MLEYNTVEMLIASEGRTFSLSFVASFSTTVTHVGTS